MSESHPMPDPTPGSGRPTALLELSVVLSRGAQAWGLRRATSGGAPQDAPFLTAYVDRLHDVRLREVVQAAVGGESRVALMLGDAATGRTRALWEALRHLDRVDPGVWRVWRPTTAGEVVDLLDGLGTTMTRTVVWLGDVRRLLPAGELDVGPRAADALRELVEDRERGPLLVLGTIWPDADHWISCFETDEGDETWWPAEVLVRDNTLWVRDTVTREEADAVREASARDPRLAVALREGGDRPIPYLAGAAAVMRRLADAEPDELAVLHAAADAHRIGVPRPLPPGFLRLAAVDHMSSAEHDGPRTPLGDRIDDALHRLSGLGDGLHAPLTTTASGGHVVADHLEQHLLRTRFTVQPHDSLWGACLALTDAVILTTLGRSARDRGRFDVAERLFRAAAAAGDPRATGALALMAEVAGDRDRADRLVLEAAATGDDGAASHLAELREEGRRSEDRDRDAREAAAAGDLRPLIIRREVAGDRTGAERLARDAAASGDPGALTALATHRWLMLETGLEALYQEAVDAGDEEAVTPLAELRGKAGDLEGAERLLTPRAEAGDVRADLALAWVRQKRRAGQERDWSAEEAAAAGDVHKLQYLGWQYEQLGRHADAERLFLEAACEEEPRALSGLARLRERAGRHDEAMDLAGRAAAAGDVCVLADLAVMRAEAGHHADAERLAARAVGGGSGDAYGRLAVLHEEEGRHAEAERLAGLAAAAGSHAPLRTFARACEDAGHHDRAERLHLLRLASGHPAALEDLARLREARGDHASADRTRRWGVDRNGVAAHPPEATRTVTG